MVTSTVSGAGSIEVSAESGRAVSARLLRLHFDEGGNQVKGHTLCTCRCARCRSDYDDLRARRFGRGRRLQPGPDEYGQRNECVDRYELRWAALKVLNSSTTNHGVLVQSAGGAGVALYGQHISGAGAGPALRGDSASTAAGAFSVYGLLSPAAAAANSAALRGESKSTNANGFGVWGSQAGAGIGVYGTSSSERSPA